VLDAMLKPGAVVARQIKKLLESIFLIKISIPNKHHPSNLNPTINTHPQPWD